MGSRFTRDKADTRHHGNHFIRLSIYNPACIYSPHTGHHVKYFANNKGKTNTTLEIFII